MILIRCDSDDHVHCGRPLEIDYEAAAKEWVGADPPEDWPAGMSWDDMITVVAEQTVKPMIDTALGLGDDTEETT